MSAAGVIAVAEGSDRSPQPVRSLPSVRQLAAVGPLLCIHRAQDAGALQGWARAVRASSDCRLDSDGLCESVQFFDADGRCCWRLFLLPDSDFLAWERLLASIPKQRVGHRSGIGERMWRRLWRSLGGPDWKAGILSLHASPVDTAPAGLVLAASLPTISACGLAVAGRILQGEGVIPAPAIPLIAPSRRPAFSNQGSPA